MSKLKVNPKTPGQREYMQSINDNKITFCTGPAGTGKTLIAASKAVDLVKKGVYDMVYIVRPAVVACNEKIGFLPGTVEDKMNPFTVPVLYNMSKLMGANEFTHFVRGKVKVIPLAFMRGMTLDNCVIILDEAQNTRQDQMKMFLTRLGEHCKVIVEGDEDQTDIQHSNGLSDAIDRFGTPKMRDVGVVEMDEGDVIRSGMVARILERYK